MTRIKICGLTSLDDARMAVEAGADALGFVFEPTSPRYIGRNAELLSSLRQLPLFVSRVMVYGNADEAHDYWEPEFDAVQFVSHRWVTVPLTRHAVQAFRVEPGATPHAAAEAVGKADALLLDAHHPHLMGGTGEMCDWDLAAEAVRLCAKPVILAGGLTPENVGEAIRRVHPYAVDVSSGVESKPGIKDPRKVHAFCRAVRECDTD
jgi:phosphoribosylanthranilate isomerase